MIDPVQAVLDVIVKCVTEAGGRFYIAQCKACGKLGARRSGERLTCCGKPMLAKVVIYPRT